MSKLSDHHKVKGILYTPWNDIENRTGIKLESTNWVHNELPEYYWLGLILDYYGRKDGLQKAGEVINYLANTLKTKTPRLSEILSLPEDKQKQLFTFCKYVMGKNVLVPLTIFHTVYDAPIFAEEYYSSEFTVKERFDKINSVLKQAHTHNTNFATDIRFLIVWFTVVSGKLCIIKGSPVANAILEYPVTDHEDEKMKMYRPSIRSTSGTLVMMNEKNELYINSFWGKVASMKDCELFMLNYAPQSDIEQIKIDVDEFQQYIEYYARLVQLEPFNDKLLVLVGISNYSLKRLRELVDHDLYNTATGRSIIRVIIEDYINMKALLLSEAKETNIWKSFQEYGEGAYKKIALKHEEYKETGNFDNSHVNYDYVNLLSKEFIQEDFLNIDIRIFGGDTRSKAKDVGEEELFYSYYDYDSQYEHGLWGAIRECSLLKCNVPAHGFHNIVDYEGKQLLPSVWNDCKTVMLKTINILADTFGVPPKFEGKL